MFFDTKVTEQEAQETIKEAKNVLAMLKAHNENDLEKLIAKGVLYASKFDYSGRPSQYEVSKIKLEQCKEISKMTPAQYIAYHASIVESVNA